LISRRRIDRQAAGVLRVRGARPHRPEAGRRDLLCRGALRRPEPVPVRDRPQHGVPAAGHLHRGPQPAAALLLFPVRARAPRGMTLPNRMARPEAAPALFRLLPRSAVSRAALGPRGSPPALLDAARAARLTPWAVSFSDRSEFERLRTELETLRAQAAPV